jgi:hypothetical protein
VVAPISCRALSGLSHSYVMVMNLHLTTLQVWKEDVLLAFAKTMDLIHEQYKIWSCCLPVIFVR